MLLTGTKWWYISLYSHHCVLLLKKNNFNIIFFLSIFVDWKFWYIQENTNYHFYKISGFSRQQNCLGVEWTPSKFSVLQMAWCGHWQNVRIEWRGCGKCQTLSLNPCHAHWKLKAQAIITSSEFHATNFDDSTTLPQFCQCSAHPTWIPWHTSC